LLLLELLWLLELLLRLELLLLLLLLSIWIEGSGLSSDAIGVVGGESGLLRLEAIAVRVHVASRLLLRHVRIHGVA
jgi:hypothetical protein